MQKLYKSKATILFRSEQLYKVGSSKCFSYWVYGGY